MTRTHHYNGLKTAVLLGGMWSLLLLLGYALTRGTGSSIWLFIVPIIGIAQLVDYELRSHRGPDPIEPIGA